MALGIRIVVSSRLKGEGTDGKVADRTFEDATNILHVDLGSGFMDV